MKLGIKKKVEQRLSLSLSQSIIGQGQGSITVPFHLASSTFQFDPITIASFVSSQNSAKDPTKVLTEINREPVTPGNRPIDSATKANWLKAKFDRSFSRNQELVRPRSKRESHLEALKDFSEELKKEAIEDNAVVVGGYAGTKVALIRNDKTIVQVTYAENNPANSEFTFSPLDGSGPRILPVVLNARLVEELGQQAAKSGKHLAELILRRYVPIRQEFPGPETKVFRGELTPNFGVPQCSFGNTVATYCPHFHRRETEQLDTESKIIVGEREGMHFAKVKQGDVLVEITWTKVYPNQLGTSYHFPEDQFDEKGTIYLDQHDNGLKILKELASVCGKQLPEVFLRSHYLCMSRFLLIARERTTEEKEADLREHEKWEEEQAREREEAEYWWWWNNL